MDLGAGEGVAGWDVREANECVHKRQLPQVIQFQAGDAFAVGQQRGLTEMPELAAVDEGLQDVLLDVEVAVRDALQRLA